MQYIKQTSRKKQYGNMWVAVKRGASARFVATGGEPLNLDDWFIATERMSRVVTVKDLETKKTQFEEAKKREEDAKAILDKYHSMNKDVTNTVHAEELTAPK